jgi:hypothetical protein
MAGLGRFMRVARVAKAMKVAKAKKAMAVVAFHTKMAAKKAAVARVLAKTANVHRGKAALARAALVKARIGS